MPTGPRELELRIHSVGDAVLVSASSRHHGEESERFPLEEWLAIGEQRVPPEVAARRSRRDFSTASTVPVAAPVAPEPVRRRQGSDLFRALFAGRIRWLYERAVEQGLRIRLVFDSRDPQLARLCSLPWESLYDPDQRQFLLLDGRCSLVRCLAVRRPLGELALASPLRVLAVVADAGSPLDLAAEVRHLQELEHRRLLRLDLLPNPAPDELRRALAEPHDVLHFMGHGGLDAAGRGVLRLAGYAATGEELVRLFGADAPRLVFLNACDTARFRGEAVDPLAGVAAELIVSGVPAVVAMQHAVTDRAAIVFADGFYAELAAGGSAESAVRRGRERLMAPGGGDEWLTPVLYLRAREPQSSPEPADGVLRTSVAVSAGIGAGALLVLLVRELMWLRGEVSHAPTTIGLVLCAAVGVLASRGLSPARRRWVLWLSLPLGVLLAGVIGQ